MLATSVCVASGCGGVAAASRDRAASIVAGHAIAGVALGDPQASVRHMLGRPDRMVSLSESETGVPISAWVYRRRGLRVSFEHAPGVIEIETRSRRDRMSGGLGVGSTLTQLRSSGRGFECIHPDSPALWCALGETPQTVFVLHRHRVVLVRVVGRFP